MVFGAKSPIGQAMTSFALGLRTLIRVARRVDVSRLTSKDRLMLKRHKRFDWKKAIY